MNTLALLLLATVPVEDTTEDLVAIIDHNTILCPSTGNETLSQYVFLDWYYQCERSHVVAWRLVKPDMQVSRVWPSGDYELLFQDGDVIRRVRGRVLVRSYDTADYEVEERSVVSQDQRRGLRSR